MTQSDVVAAVIDILNTAGIGHMIVGSFASNYHGVPRMTQDADIVIDVDAAAVTKLVKRFEQEFYVSEDAALEAVRTRRLFNVIHLATGFKVDLVVKKRRRFSDEEFDRREVGSLANRAVPFASAEDTILTKLEWAAQGESERQYGDAVGVINVQGEKLDWEYLEHWAQELRIRNLLSRARRGEPFR